ncbi:MAG: sulfotransferase, partial [Dehalococcoidia bacterium]
MTELNDTRNPYLFIVGAPRSGTTLLQRMLDSHPQLAVVNDSRFIPLVIKDFPEDIDPPLTADRVDRVRHFRDFKRTLLTDLEVTQAAAAS